MTEESVNETVVVDVKMPFWSMVVFMVKWAIAAIPALIILIVFFATSSVALYGFVTGLMIGKTPSTENIQPSPQNESHQDSQQFRFDEKITANLKSVGGGNHFIQIPVLELSLATSNVKAKVKARESELLNLVNSTLQTKTLKEMLEPGSDIALKVELKAAINSHLNLDDSNGVTEVLLPQSFVVI